jgi:[ribosomal protein S5]-alanine N-acetyltransferase
MCTMKSTLLRPVCSSDRAAFVAAARASKALHGGWVSPPLDTGAFKKYLARFDGQHHFGLLVVHATSGDLVGAIHITNAIFGGFQSAYLGYYAFAGRAGQGLMKQGLQAAVRHAFKDLKLHRLEANIQPDNAASIALVRACGFQKEGFSPAYLKINGRWRDQERWAIVRTA